MIIIDNVTETLFFRSVFKGYIDNVTETLFFSLLFNGYIDSATGTLIFIFLTVILKTLPERCFLVQFLIARARVCV